MDNIYNSQRKVWLAFGLTVLFMLFFSFFAKAQWTQQGADIDGEANSNNFGVSVSFSSDGSKVAIGAPYNAGGGTSRGRVRIYAWSGSAWTQQGGNIDGEADFDESGLSVSMSADGNKVAIGAQYNAGGGFESGHVRVYTWNGTAWVQQGADINGEAASDRSGSAVALSADGTRLIIGAQLNTGGGSNRGHARVYAWSGSAWVQQGADINGEADGDESGRAVAISSDGSKVIIGAHYNTAGAGVFADRGHARVYSWSGSAWVQQGADIDGVANSNLAGSAVSMSSDGNKIAVGAPNNAGGGSARGHVRVFTWSGSAWVQQGTSLNGEADNNGFGTAVSLSSDGNRLAVGAPYNAGAGTNAGHVRVFEWSGSAWTQVGTDIDAESAGNRAGFAVSLTSDGTKVAIGAPFNPAGGTNRGHVRVYGSAVATPTIVSSGSLSALSTVYGTASSNTSFSVSGTNMTAGILVTPPAGFEVSLSAGSGFGSSVTVGSAGTIASTTVYVRLSAIAIPNTYSGNIVLSSAGATNVNVATVASTVSAKGLTITGVSANNKIYNANTTATLSGSPTLVGTVGGDIVSLDVSAVTAFFNNKNVGTAKPVNTFNYALTGANAGNYTLTQPVLSADITPKTLTVSGAVANNKVYDGNTVATLGGSPTFVGVAGFDAIGMTYNTASAVGTFADKNVGVGKTVTTSGYSIGGANAGNYTVTQPTLTADITKKMLVTNSSANNKVYDNTNTATLSSAITSGIVGSESVSINIAGVFSSVSAGNNIPIVLTTFAPAGADASNYEVTLPTLTANILPAIYRTVGNVTFGSATNWESSPDGSTWNTATYYPDATPNTANISIRNTHTATLSINISLDEVAVENGGILRINTGNTLTIASDIAITGGILELQGTSTIGGTGNFTLATNSTLKIAHTTGFQAINVSGTKTFQAGANYEINGTSLQTINNPTGISAHNFTLNNASGATLSQDMTVTNMLTISNGDLDLNGKNINLQGTLAEDRTNNHIVKDLTAVSDIQAGGGIIFSATVTDATNEIAGTGLYLRGATGANYSVTVTRKHYKGAIASRGGHGIARIYQIIGTPNQPTTMRIYYANDEIIGAGNVADFVLYRWTSGTGWKNAFNGGTFSNGTNDNIARYAEATNITAFSHWTVGSSASPLPVTLVGLKGKRVEGLRGEMTEGVRLEWSTASEINNKGFELEMSADGLTYQNIAFIEGKSNSTTIQPYNHTIIQPNNAYYRLKQLDFDGSYSYSPVVFVEGMELLKVYPNPNKGSFMVMNQTQNIATTTSRLLDVWGRQVWVGKLEKGLSAIHLDVPKGIYFLHTIKAGKAEIVKVVIE